jgi:hypothetical protein
MQSIIISTIILQIYWDCKRGLSRKFLYKITYLLATTHSLSLIWLLFCRMQYIFLDFFLVCKAVQNKNRTVLGTRMSDFSLLNFKSDSGFSLEPQIPQIIFISIEIVLTFSAKFWLFLINMRSFQRMRGFLITFLEDLRFFWNDVKFFI